MSKGVSGASHDFDVTFSAIFHEDIEDFLRISSSAAFAV